MQKRNYGLAALDMDGTLLNSQHETTAYTKRVLHRAVEAGKVVALATGRCLSELQEHVQELGCVQYLICENGACVYDTQNKAQLRGIALCAEDVDYVMSLAAKYDCLYQFFCENQSYMGCAVEQSFERYHIESYRSVFEKGSIFDDLLYARVRQSRPSIEKVNLYFANRMDCALFRSEMKGRNVLLADSIGIGVEISPVGANKGEGLAALCAHLKLPIEEAMAVGDGGNDLDIMRMAGLAVAMGNAIPEVIQLASAVTEDCDHDGAAKAIEKYMLCE